MTLEEIKQTAFGCLCEFALFCQQNGIRYYLSNGTLLGAIKYGGFIPWDDDVDVFVPREDYNRLIKTYIDSEKYLLYSIERNRKYLFPFAKLCDMSTEKIESNIYNGVSLGVDIDIFPLDNLGDNLECAKKTIDTQAELIKKQMFHKCEKAASKNTVKRLIKDIVLNVSRPLCRYYTKVLSQNAQKHMSSQMTSYVGCVAWCIYGHREILSRDIFLSSDTKTFQKLDLNVPVGYDVYLRSLYGDYEKDPPADKCVSHHRFKAYFR